MKQYYFIITTCFLWLGSYLPIALAQTTGDYRSNGAVNFASISNWERFNGTAWVNAIAGQIPSNTSGVITIRNGHTATINSNIDLDQVIVQSGGILTYNSGTFNILNGAGDDVAIESGGIFILNFSNVPLLAASATIRVKTNGVLRVESNSSGQGDDFVNGNSSGKVIYETGAIFDWNTALPFNTAGITFFPDATTAVIPIFRISVNSANLGGNTPTIFNGTLEAIGNVTWTNSGVKIFRNGIIGTGNVTQNSSTTGQFQITGTNAILGGSGTIVLNTNGLQITNTADVKMTSNKTINVGGGNPTFLVNGILDCQTFNLVRTTGTPNFTLNANATLKIGSIDGITTSGTVGNIQLTGTRNYNKSANYEYKGIATQTTGNGLPDTLKAKLTINHLNNGIVIQTAASHVISGGQMELLAGTYDLKSKNFTWYNANIPITRTNGNIDTNNSTNLSFLAGGNLFTLPNGVFLNNPALLNNFTVNRNNDLKLGNQHLAVAGTVNVGTSLTGDLDLNGNNIDLGDTGGLVEQLLSSVIATDNTATTYSSNKGGYIRATNRNINGSNIAGLGISLSNATAGTVNISRYHCKVTGTPSESIRKVFEITASVTANNATMTISYSPQDLVGTSLSDASANFRLHRGTQNPWSMQPSPATIASCHDTSNKRVFANNISGFSPWTAAPEITLLPITWLNFAAYKKDQQHLELQWQVCNEQNNWGFYVQKSENGQDFHTIATVLSAKQDATIRHYKFIDKLSASKLVFYRVQQKDFDGTTTYSKTICVQPETTICEWEILPTSFEQHTSIQTNMLNDTQVMCQLSSSKGEVLQIWRGELATVNTLFVSYLTHLTNGVYLVSLYTPTCSLTKKICKE